jgi:hypothetical protein
MAQRPRRFCALPVPLRKNKESTAAVRVAVYLFIRILLRGQICNYPIETRRLEGKSQGVSEAIGISPGGETPPDPPPLFFTDQTV